MAIVAKGTGWRPDVPDVRDFKFAVPRAAIAAAPKSVDLRGTMPPVWDQGDLGSCTGFTTAAVVQYLVRKQRRTVTFPPSQLFIYYNARHLEGTVPYDAGATIRSAIKAVNQFGVCSYDLWPYDISKFTRAPGVDAYSEAKEHQALTYQRVSAQLPALRAVLALRIPIVVGISIYSSFFSDTVARTGIVPLPDPRTEESYGGHAVVVQGYNERKKMFLMRNSWGASWGVKGAFWLPYDYLLNPDLSADFWAITLMEQR